MRGPKLNGAFLLKTSPEASQRRPMLVYLLLVTGILTSCTQTESQKLERIPIGKPFLSFDEAAVTDFTISLRDPVYGNSWTASFKKTDVHSEQAHCQSTSPGCWMIESAPDGKKPRDRLADSIFIQHLLSLLKTAQAVQAVPSNDRARYGLETPYYAIRWGNSTQTQELWFGDTSPEGGRYAWMPAQGSTVGPSQIVDLRGSVVQMLELIRTFDRLRSQNLMTETSDDVDEIELYRDGRKILYAQRQGDHWADARDRQIHGDRVSGIIEGLAHLRIKSFLDEEAPPAASRHGHARFKAVLKDRRHHATEISLSPEGERMIATVSSRADSRFETYPEAVRYWSQVQKQ